MAISVKQLETYIQANYNVLIKGPAGTGKTAMLMEACNALGLRVKYYSASTLDPFADLVGIPVPNTETKQVEYYRPRDVDEADVVFCDELNRADSKTLNALFEMIQFRTINGEPLPKLKCVVAAINPVSEDYDTEELDLALIDRFDIYLETDTTLSTAYFRNKYGNAYAKAGTELFAEYQRSYKNSLRSSSNKLGYFSPRRLDKLMEIFKKFPTQQTVAAVLPAEVLVNHRQCAQLFSDALNGVERPAAPARTAAPASTQETQAKLQIKLAAADMRKSANAPQFNAAYAWAKQKDPRLAKQMLNKLTQALNHQVGPETIQRLWKAPVADMTPTQYSAMKQGWVYTKTRKMDELKRCW